VRLRHSEPTFLDSILREQRVIVCCGAGGVGKTTTAAALGIAAARLGRRALVLTIDPARRLAEAMGLSSERCDRPKVVPPERLRAAGVDGPGELHAWMLSPKDVIEGVVRRFSETPEQVERVLHNRLYRHFADLVLGLQEYTAGEALYLVTAGHEYDLVILDTPPSRNALDFLDAPRKLSALLDEKVISLFLPRTGGPRLWGGVVRLVQRAFTAAFGTEFFAELQEFVAAIAHMFHEVQIHAAYVRTLLGSPEAAFVLVTSSDPPALAEAEFFRERILSMELPLRGTVLNRSWAFTRGLGRPRALTLPPDASAELRRGLEKLARLADAEWEWAERDRALLATLKAQALGHALATPHVGDAIESLAGLVGLAENLVLPSVARWEVDEPPPGPLVPLVPAPPLR
jgi:anion-transporting  ArsA/GET3 family ATPase